MFYSQYGRFAALAVFAVIAALHLFYKKHKNLTKTFLLPSIMLYYLLSVTSPSLIVIGAMAMSWLGDVLLEKDGMPWFVSGGVAFMLSHILFTYRYITLTDFSSLRIAPVIILSAVYLIIAAITIVFVRKGTPKHLSFPLYLYLAFNAAMNVFAFCVLLTSPGAAGIILLAGAVMFFISDNCLFVECFHPKKPELFFPVMFTYIAGEFLIAQALISL